MAEPGAQGRWSFVFLLDSNSYTAQEWDCPKQPHDTHQNYPLNLLTRPDIELGLDTHRNK